MLWLLSNVNVILAITNFHLYLTPLCDRFPVPLWMDMLMQTNKQKSDLFLITNKTKKDNFVEWAPLVGACHFIVFSMTMDKRASLKDGHLVTVPTVWLSVLKRVSWLYFVSLFSFLPLFKCEGLKVEQTTNELHRIITENTQIVNLQGMYISNIVKKVKMLPQFPESLYQILVVQTYPSLQMLPV